MERRMMDDKAIEQRIGDVWFTNGYGDRFPARDSHVMLAIEGGVVTYSSNGHDSEMVEHSSERLCIRLQQRDRNDTRLGYWLTFYEYGDGNYRKIFQVVINARHLSFHWKYGDGRKMMKFVERGVQIAFISLPENATIYEDDWRKCEKCGMEKRLHVNPIDSMFQGKYTTWKAMCGHGHLFEYY